MFYIRGSSQKYRDRFGVNCNKIKLNCFDKYFLSLHVPGCLKHSTLLVIASSLNIEFKHSLIFTSKKNSVDWRHF